MLGSEVRTGRSEDSQSVARATTFLSPGLPEELFQGICRYLAKHLEGHIELSLEARHSGPMHGDVDPFRDGQADIGFLCSPSYLYLRGLERPSVRLIPAAFAFGDPRAKGQPVYFSEVVVLASHPARNFKDLAGGTWGYNDECSLSGYFSTIFKLSELNCDAEFFGRRVRTGSHEHSLEGILNGSIHGAAIDSSVFAHWRELHPDLVPRLRVIDSWGPFPIQPIVVRDTLSTSVSDHITSCLLNLGSTPKEREWFASFGLEGFVPSSDELYAEERDTLVRLGVIAPPRKQP